MAKEQKGFVVYGDIEESLDELTDEQVAKLFRGMVNYFNTGKDPKFTGVLKLAFIPIRQQMDRDVDKYEKKCQKNKENIQAYWDKVKGEKENTNVYERIPPNTNATNTNTNTKTNANTKTETDTSTTSSETDVSSLSSFLIEHLNEKTGSTYEATDTITERVASLIESGYSPDQLRTVIDKKCSEWLNDDKMRTYLRPSTLFGDKFSEYLAAPITLAQEREQDTERKRKSLASELKQKRDTLGVLKASLDEIPRGTRMDERRVLKDQIAALEDSIDLIERRLS